MAMKENIHNRIHTSTRSFRVNYVHTYPVTEAQPWVVNVHTKLQKLQKKSRDGVYIAYAHVPPSPLGTDGG